MQKQISSKITRPAVSGIFERDRVFRLIDAGRSKPVLWVSGPAGSGKTTLVASYLDARNLPCIWYLVDEGDADLATFFYYMGRAVQQESVRAGKNLPLLTPEYFQGIRTFTRRYFEDLSERFTPPFTIVFDNYQDVPVGSDFHEMLVCGLEVIPAGITVIIVSRNDPPRQFARLRANNRIDFIGWDEIRFSPVESREVLRTYGQASLRDEAFAELYSKTEGWMAGLVLFMEGTRRAGIDRAAFSKLVPETIFDYFANEIFEKTEGMTRQFLLKTSVLPSMTAGMAEQLTGIATSAQILVQLYNSHYFIEMRTGADPVYRYHPLFREFLLNRMKSMLSLEERTLILRKAAAILGDAGQTEHAVQLLREAQDWEGVVSTILEQARSLMEEGRANTLLDWISGLPVQLVSSVPWLLYWKGMSRMPFDLIESRTILEQAYQAFKQQKDAAGLYPAWSGIVNTYTYEWGDMSPLDRWIAEMEGLTAEYPEILPPEIEAQVISNMFSALMYRQPKHSQFRAWEQKMLRLISTSTDLRLRTMISIHPLFYYSWMTGDLKKCAYLLDILRSGSYLQTPDPLSLIVLRCFEGGYYWLIAEQDKCLNAVHEGLKTGKEHGIHA